MHVNIVYKKMSSLSTCINGVYNQVVQLTYMHTLTHIYIYIYIYIYSIQPTCMLIEFTTYMCVNRVYNLDVCY